MMDMGTWLRGVINEVSANGQYHKVELFHGTADAPPERLDTIELRFANGAVVEVDKLELHIKSISQQDADTHAAVGNGLVQRYVLAAFHVDAELPGTTFPFAVRGAEPLRSVSEALTGTEPPTDRGERSQIMRLNDNLMRIHMATWETSHGLLMRQLAESERRREAAEARALDTWVLQQNLLDRQQDRIADAARTEADLVRREELWQMIKSYVPTLISGFPSANKTALLGKAVFDLVAGMSPEEAQAVAAVLPPQRRLQLQNVFRIAAEEAERIANETPDVKVDAAEPPSAKKKGGA